MTHANYEQRILCLWLPNWPIQRFLASKPQLKRRAIVLYEPCRGTCFRVIASSKNATVRLGTPLAEAKATVSAHFELHDSHADKLALLKMAEWCEQFSPIVGIEGTDNLCFDITGLEHIYGTEEQFANRIRERFSRLSFEVRIAIANTLGAAWGLAHYGRRTIELSHSDDAITTLPIDALRLADKHVDTLREVGIDNVGLLQQFSRADLIERFEPSLLLRLDQATGIATELIVSHRPLPDIAAEMELEYGVVNRLSIETILSKLIEKVCDTLNKRQQGAIQLVVQLYPERGTPLKVLVGLYHASCNPKHLLDLTLTQFERLTLPGPIYFVNLSVLVAAPLQNYQQDLFEDSLGENNRQVSLLIDRLSSRLGRHAVSRAVLHADAQPEMAFRYEPLTGVLKRKRKEYSTKIIPRPLLLEKNPIPIRVCQASTNAFPYRFEWHDFHDISKAWGPERIQTAWWRSRYVQRDYYRIETKRGKRFWIFRRLQDGQWFLHGAFD